MPVRIENPNLEYPLFLWESDSGKCAVEIFLQELERESKKVWRLVFDRLYIASRDGPRAFTPEQLKPFRGERYCGGYMMQEFRIKNVRILCFLIERRGKTGFLLAHAFKKTKNETDTRHKVKAEGLLNRFLQEPV